MPHPGKTNAVGKNTEVTLKKFRKHSRSPGVRELLNDRVKRTATGERRRRRQSSNDARSHPRPCCRSPMLDAAKCKTSLEKLQQVRNVRVVLDKPKRDTKFQDILGIAICDPVGDGEGIDHDFELDLSNSLSEICQVEEEPRKGREYGSSPDISCRVSSGPRIVMKSENTSDNARQPRRLWSSLEQAAENGKRLSQGLNPTNILKLSPFLTTISDRVNYLKSILAEQDGCDSSSDSNSEDDFVREGNARAQLTTKGNNRSGDTFLMGEPATLKSRNSSEIGKFKEQDMNHQSVSTWLGEFGRGDFSPGNWRNEDGHVISDRADTERGDGLFAYQFAANLANLRTRKTDFRCSSTPDPFLGAPHMDVDIEPYDSSPLQFPTDTDTPSPSRCCLFEDIEISASDFGIYSRDARSPGLERYENLAKRSRAVLQGDDDRTPPNFFGVPRSLM